MLFFISLQCIRNAWKQKRRKQKTGSVINGPHQMLQRVKLFVFPPRTVGPAVIASRLHFHSPALIWIFQPQIIRCFPPRCSNLFYPHFSFCQPRRPRMNTRVTQVLLGSDSPRESWMRESESRCWWPCWFDHSFVSRRNINWLSSFCCNITSIYKARSGGCLWLVCFN